MAISDPEPATDPDRDSVKNQTAPKMLLVWLVLGVIIVAVVAGYVLTHNHGGTSAGSIGQPADRAVGPQLGTEGPATGRTVPAGGVTGTAAGGQGGGPGAMGSGLGSGGGTPGTAGTRTGGASSGAPAGPSAGAPGTAP